MAYIPTIHTFQDDLEENRNEFDKPISGGVEPVTPEANIEDKKDIKTKYLLLAISIIFISSSISVLAFYFYNKKQEELSIIKTNTELANKINTEKQRAGIVENIKAILPNMYENSKIDQYIESITLDKNVITVKISNNQSGDSNYSLFASQIIANEKPFKKDIISSFKLKDIIETKEIPIEIYSTTSSKESTTTIVNKKKVIKLIGVVSTTSTTTLVSTSTITKLKDINDITFTDKTISNYDIKIADTGVSTIVYGYISNKYLLITTTIKDFIDSAELLNK